MKFINRENEIKQLNKEYIKKEASFVIIYGRRRTGKTTLIEKFISDKPSVYFLADLQKEFLQMNRFKDIFSNIYQDDLLNNVEIKSWDALFDRFLEKINANEKTIFVIDEFQSLVKSNSEVVSIFQRIWDQKLKKENIMLIFCGSLISMMYKTTLSYSSPLYGRRTSDIKLQPLDFYDFMKFFPKMDFIKSIEAYSVLGGIPKYINMFDSTKKLFFNIKEEILNKNSFLYEEAKFLLKEEINEISTYFSILKVISEGEHKIGKIASKLNINQNNLTSFFDKLRELDVIERQVPVTENFPEKSKKGLYFIKDNFLKFWFRYVFSYQSYLEIGNIDFVIDKIKQEFSNYVSFIFEKVMIEFTMRQKLPFCVKKIGRWWNKNDEIDVVAIGKDEILVGECKWNNKLISKDVLFDLFEKVQRNQELNHYKKKYYAFYSKIGFSQSFLIEAKKYDNILLFNFYAEKS